VHQLGEHREFARVTWIGRTKRQSLCVEEQRKRLAEPAQTPTSGRMEVLRDDFDAMTRSRRAVEPRAERTSKGNPNPAQGRGRG